MTAFGSFYARRIPTDSRTKLQCARVRAHAESLRLPQEEVERCVRNVQTMAVHNTLEFAEREAKLLADRLARNRDASKPLPESSFDGPLHA